MRDNLNKDKDRDNDRDKEKEATSQAAEQASILNSVVNFVFYNPFVHVCKENVDLDQVLGWVLAVAAVGVGYSCLKWGETNHVKVQIPNSPGTFHLAKQQKKLWLGRSPLCKRHISGTGTFKILASPKLVLAPLNSGRLVDLTTKSA